MNLKLNLVGCLIVVFLAALPLALAQEAREIKRRIRADSPQAVRVPMRDGIKLSADLYLPEKPDPFPTLVHMTPYRRRPGQAKYFASEGYAVLKVSLRGRFGSEGAWNRSRNKAVERQDGYDIIEWAARQPWSTGRVGTYGISGPGVYQLKMAPARPPHLRAMFVSYPAHLWDGFADRGVYFSLTPTWWLLFDDLARPLSSGADWEAWLSDWRRKEIPLFTSFLHPEFIDWFLMTGDEDFWKKADPTTKFSEIDVPIFHEGGWYDRYCGATFRDFNAIRSRARSEGSRKAQKVLMGPWTHGGGVPATEAVPFGSEARIDRRALQLRWFDYWLKGIDTGITAEAPVQVFVMGADRWLDAESWPLPQTGYRRYYLRAGLGTATRSLNDGRLTQEAPEENEKTDEYVHDPYDPLPTIGGHGGGASPGGAPGPGDQRPAEERSLTYTSEPLAEDLLVVGDVRLRFFAASSAVDTDFVLTLTDVYPNGYSATLRQNGVRAMYWLGENRKSPLEPGRVYEFSMTLDPIANLFRVGHRIRLNIASSSFPRFLPNPGTGQPLPLVTKGITARNKVYHDSRYPSAIELPVLDAKLASYRPTIELTRPVRDYFDSGESVLLRAKATAYGETEARQVEFIADGSLIGSDTDAPFSFKWTGAENGRHIITAKVRDGKGRTKESFPVTIFVGMRALERSVSRSTDDAEEHVSASMYIDSSDLELINDGRRGDQIVGMRFTDIPLPKGATIKKAYLQFTVRSVSTEPTDLTIHAELAANAQTFTQVKRNISSRKRTLASVKWSPEHWDSVRQRSEKQRTPDLSSLLQEVIDQPDWRDGNAMVLIISGSGRRVAKSYDGDPAAAPMLHIEY